MVLNVHLPIRLSLDRVQRCSCCHHRSKGGGILFFPPVNEGLTLFSLLKLLDNVHGVFLTMRRIANTSFPRGEKAFYLV